MFSRKKEKQRDPATWEHTREINEVYKDCNSLCTHSGYANIDTKGELVFQTWPEKNKEAFNDLRKRANEVRKNYAASQIIDMDRPENLEFMEASRNRDGIGMPKLHIGQVQLKTKRSKGHLKEYNIYSVSQKSKKVLKNS